MIKTFRDKETEQLFNRLPARRLPANLQQAMWRKLAILNAAERLEDLRIPPGNRLEKLSGKRAGQYSIRVNDQWRVIFKWSDGDAYEVRVIDYH